MYSIIILPFGEIKVRTKHNATHSKHCVPEDGVIMHLKLLGEQEKSPKLFGSCSCDSCCYT